MRDLSTEKFRRLAELGKEISNEGERRGAEAIMGSLWNFLSFPCESTRHSFMETARKYHCGATAKGVSERIYGLRFK